MFLNICFFNFVSEYKSTAHLQNVSAHTKLGYFCHLLGLLLVTNLYVSDSGLITGQMQS